MKVYIYTLSDPITNRVCYVGKTQVNVKVRFSQHKYNSKKSGRLNKLNSWIKSLLVKKMTPIIDIIDTVYENDWQESEKYYIKLYSQLYVLKNETEGGEGTVGYKAKKESILKRLQSIEDSKLWKEKCKNHSEIMKEIHAAKNVNFGYGHLPESKRKKIGKNHSEKMKKLYAQNPHMLDNFKNSRKRAVISLKKNGDIDKKFTSVTEAGKYYNINPTHITRVCKEKSKSTHGIVFKYDVKAQKNKEK